MRVLKHYQFFNPMNRCTRTNGQVFESWITGATRASFMERLDEYHRDWREQIAKRDRQFRDRPQMIRRRNCTGKIVEARFTTSYEVTLDAAALC